MLSIGNYHYIKEQYDYKYPSIFGVTPEGFKKQLKLLKNSGDIVSVSDFLTQYKDLSKDKGNYYFITFDDGLKEQYKYALPILDELNTEALFFANSLNTDKSIVTTVHKIHLIRSEISPKELIDLLAKNVEFEYSDEMKKKSHQCYRFDDKESAEVKYLLNFLLPFKQKEIVIDQLFKSYFDEQSICESLYMNKEELRNLATRGLLGSHTHNHYPLGLLSKDEIEFELKYSKKYLEELTGKTMKTVAYPYGTPEACTEEVAKTARALGYVFGFTTTKGQVNIHDDKLLINRFDCNDIIGGKNYGN